MAEITIQLPNNVIVEGSVDAGATILTLKKYLITNYNLNIHPNDLDLAILRNDESKTIGQGISDGDRIILMERSVSRPPFKEN